jgi:transposase
MKTKYRPDFPERVKHMMKWDGLTHKQCAKSLSISEDTFYKYIKRYPEFAEAVKEGEKSIVLELENALFKKATGYDK